VIILERLRGISMLRIVMTIKMLPLRESPAAVVPRTSVWLYVALLMLAMGTSALATQRKGVGPT